MIGSCAISFDGAHLLEDTSELQAEKSYSGVEIDRKFTLRAADRNFQQFLDQLAIALEERPHSKFVIHAGDPLVCGAERIQLLHARVFSGRRSNDYFLVSSGQEDSRRITRDERRLVMQSL